MSQSQFYEVLHREPTVVYAKVPWKGYFARCFETKQPVAILAATNWMLYRHDKAEAIQWAKDQEQRWGHYVEFLLDRPDEVELFRDRFGLNVTEFNPNALCDERVFRPLPRAKEFAASYIARPAPRKQIELCREIEGKWLWLTYDAGKYPEIVADTLAMPNVEAPQYEGNHYTGYVKRENVPGFLCKSRCGLALSREEGSNYASAESLLCGLPVVACPGECTRDQLFDERTAIITKANPFAVAQAVQDAADMAKCVRPETIREITLQKMQPHRERFVDACRRAYRAVGIEHDPAFDLFHLFRHQMLLWQPVDNVLQGGDDENRELLRVADEEPKTRKLWAAQSGRYWEHALPEPVA